MRRSIDTVLRYGTTAALALMCVALSLLTMQESFPSDPNAARVLASQIANDIASPANLLIIVGESEADRAYAAALDDSLTSAGYSVQNVRGKPSDARKALEGFRDRNAPLAAIAAQHETARWLVIETLDESFPELGDVRVFEPAAYIWPRFLSADNVRNVVKQISVIAIIAVGMTMVIITAGIDLSVGSLIALASVVAGLLIRHWGGVDAPWWAMVVGSLAGVLVCGLVGAFSGTMVITMNIPPFIVTLAMMMVASGAAFLLADGHSIPELPARYTWLGRDADLFGIPNRVVLMFLIYAVAHLLLTRTVLGRHIYAVGDNANAAWLSGISVKRVLLFTYIVSGLLAGVGGIIFASDYQSGDPRYGIMYELHVIAAVVVGGTSLSGGRGTVIGTLIGALIIGVINNGMNLLTINSHAQKVILGLVILAAVMLDKLKDRWAES